MNRRWFLLGAAALLVLAGTADARMHAPYRGHRIVPAATALLDGFTQPATAYSFRKLRTAYTGPAMRVVKWDTLAELDVGFTASGDFNSAAALAHCGGPNDCYIMTAYDQSGNSRHAVQATHGNRPQLYLNCLGIGKPCARSGWASIGLSSTATAPGAGLHSFSAVGNRSAGTGMCSFITKSLNSIRTHNVDPPANWWLVAFYGGEILAPAVDNAWHSANAVLDGGGTSVIRIDGIETTGGVVADTTAGGFGFIGGDASTVCDAVEGIVWDNYSLTLDQRVALENNQRNYWTPYSLDNLVQPAGAYSMRRLRSAYTGPAIRIFRISDNAIIEPGFLGFVPGLGAPIDFVAVNTHCAATTCYIEAWYDQSGNGRDAWNDGNSLQLVLNCIGSLPCAQSQTNGQRVLFGPVGAFVAKSSVSVVGKRVSGAAQCYFMQKGLNLIGAENLANTWLATDFTSGSYQMPATDGVWHAGMAITPTGVAAIGRIDATETVGPALTGAAGGHLIIMPTNTGTVCQTPEVIAWDNYALTAGERTFLQTNQKGFWGTP